MTEAQQPSFTWPPGKRAAISLSFDDARHSQVDVCIPILDRYNVKATFYLSPPNIGQRQESWRAAGVHGHEMGNHTMTHPCTGNFPWSLGNSLEHMTRADMEAEIQKANDFILDAVGVQPHSFAYPCGQKYVGRGETVLSYVPLIARHFVAGRGFRDETVNNPSYCDLAQAVGVDSDDQDFTKLKVWVDRTVQEGGWLIFASHDVGIYPRQAMLADTLDTLCKYCTNPDLGIWVDTVSSVGGYIQQHRTREGLEG